MAAETAVVGVVVLGDVGGAVVEEAQAEPDRLLRRQVVDPPLDGDDALAGGVELLGRRVVRPRRSFLRLLRFVILIVSAAFLRLVPSSRLLIELPPYHSPPCHVSPPRAR